MGSFANFNDYDLLEKCVAHAIASPRPPRKYEIDQETTVGIIKGFYWVSIPTSYNEAVYPGWWYIIEANHEQGHYLEANIESVGSAPSPTDSLIKSLTYQLTIEERQQEFKTLPKLIQTIARQLCFGDIILALKLEAIARGYSSTIEAIDELGDTLSLLEEVSNVR